MSVQQDFALVRSGTGAFSVNQPAYLTNNWRAIQAAEQYVGYAKYIKVMGGVATITNGCILVRSRIDGLPDGFYEFDDTGHLVDSSTSLIESVFRPYRNYYSSTETPPDPEIVRPDFPNLTHTPPIAATEVREMIDFLNHVRGQHRSDTHCYVFFEGSALISASNVNTWLKLSCEIPVNPDGGNFQTNMLRLILTDMLRYEHIFVGRDNRSPPEMNIRMPLVFGLDWSSCGLIKPGS